ncbi:uncharacterized protein LOC102801312 [Saccoglossus kowalevskii]|uniref:Uncharacterized protein LOC102801312 n=1 Tax=Saccoglossus kowalevskii TaxID=10224 RepID=A0ABM0M199_SACKO|nr:PREDICTED: uncharacterized protein LOC102801312 [Saccoglossus kowalevskii]
MVGHCNLIYLLTSLYLGTVVNGQSRVLSNRNDSYEAGIVISTEESIPENIHCASPYRVYNQASLDFAVNELIANGEYVDFWIDGTISGSTITFSDGTRMAVDSSLFHRKEPNGSGACIQLWYRYGEWKLDDTTCDDPQKYLCSAGIVISTEELIPENIHCASPYKVYNQASLDLAVNELLVNREYVDFWVDGIIAGSTIIFSDGTRMVVDSSLFHRNEPNRSGACIQLWYHYGEWKLDDTPCDDPQKYLCSAALLISSEQARPFQCASPYRITDGVSLNLAVSALSANGEYVDFWVDGVILGSTIIFSDGTFMEVDPSLFHVNEPNGSGSCIQLWFHNNEWKLDDTPCYDAQRYLCVN